ncbi:hypothetical protein KORDIASMS9_01975 [Kordia sp. SMS9]|uniref:hypothetical protein n=1 Tax=Kordia sp. SMS9 TaxID=2282170 RepID=UPI000E0D5F13|nr:hypothetical protein [Kordia sp. SMS9]AXG69748.1 hypothetical protein KORDIASMS9_01975 [Kordia sp. SMS9]
MERFTNDRDEFFNQVKIELSTITSPKGISGRFTYLEIPYFMRYGFSVSGFEENASELLVKSWDAEYDWNRFKTGVFNLDRLAIHEHTIVLSQAEVNTLNVLLAKELCLVECKGITLDGYYCQYSTNAEKLNWNTNYELNGNMTALIDFLRGKVNEVLE